MATFVTSDLVCLFVCLLRCWVAGFLPSLFRCFFLCFFVCLFLCFCFVYFACLFVLFVCYLFPAGADLGDGWLKVGRSLGGIVLVVVGWLGWLFGWLVCAKSFGSHNLSHVSPNNHYTCHCNVHHFQSTVSQSACQSASQPGSL